MPLTRGRVACQSAAGSGRHRSMKTLSKPANGCKPRNLGSPQGWPPAGQDEPATCLLTGFTTGDLDAWPAASHVPPTGSDCRQFSDRCIAGTETPVWRGSDCRQSPAVPPANVTGQSFRDPAPCPPCGKDVKTRSDCGGGFCPRAVYLYPQITVSGIATKLGLLLLWLSRAGVL